MKRICRCSLSLILLVAGCERETHTPLPPEIRALPRSLTPAESTLVEASNAFSLALFREASAAHPRGTVVLSPFGVGMSLAMVMNAASGPARDSVSRALRVEQIPLDSVNASHRTLRNLLATVDPTTEMQFANAVWLRRELLVEPAFREVIHRAFDAEAALLDFEDPATLATVNAWVRAHTNGRIASIVNRLDARDQAIFVNATYFKGWWRTAFNVADTRPEPFLSAQGVKREVPMMQLVAHVRASEAADGTKSVELPYGNGAYAMVIVLPASANTVDALVDSLRPTGWRGLTARLSPREVHLWLPRARIEYTRELRGDLARLGMALAFDTAADLSALSHSRGARLQLSKVVHRVFIAIDESGTEAAAATATTVVTDSAPAAPLEVRCDRPYLVVIRERWSGAVLFMGKINAL